MNGSVPGGVVGVFRGRGGALEREEEGRLRGDRRTGRVLRKEERG